MVKEVVEMRYLFEGFYMTGNGWAKKRFNAF